MLFLEAFSWEYLFNLFRELKGIRVRLMEGSQERVRLDVRLVYPELKVFVIRRIHCGVVHLPLHKVEGRVQEPIKEQEDLL